jgi:hypothetical protein
MIPKKALFDRTFLQHQSNVGAGAPIHPLNCNLPFARGKVCRGLRSIWKKKIRDNPKENRWDTLPVHNKRSLKHLYLENKTAAWYLNDKQKLPNLNGGMDMLNTKCYETPKSTGDCRKANPKSEL